MPGLATVPGNDVLSQRWSEVLSDALADLAWSSDGSLLFAGSADGSIVRFDSAGESRAAWQAHEAGVTRLAIKPDDDNILASAGEDGHVTLWRSHSGEQQALLADEGSWVELLAWTPDGKVLAGAASKTLSVWRGEESLGFWFDVQRRILAMDWAPDSRRLATASNKGLYLWRLDEEGSGHGEPMQLLSFPGAPVSVAWEPRGRALAVGTQDGFLQVWRQAGGSKGPHAAGKASQLTMRGYPGKVTCLAWHPFMPLIATAGGPDVVLWKLPLTGKGAKGQPLREHKKTVITLAWSPDGQLLASGDRSGLLCLWSRVGELLYSQPMGNEISVLRWCPDCSALAVGDTDGQLRVLDNDSLDHFPQHQPESGGAR